MRDSPPLQPWPPASRWPFLAGGGEMGERMRTFEWSATPLGSPDAWPQSLRTAVGICLNCRFPILLLWGPDFLHFYNDEYREILGSKHPALAAPARKVWSEIWDTVGPMLNGVRDTGEASRARDLLLPIAGRGTDPPEDRWFSFSYSPMVDETGRVAGIFCPVIETTGTVRAQRRLEVERGRLNDLFEQAPSFMAVLEGPAHRFALVNATFNEVFGHRDLLGRDAREAFPEVEGQGFFEMLDEVRRSGRAINVRSRPIVTRTPDGTATEERFIDLVYQPIRSSEDGAGGIFIQGVDVTERIQRERADACLRAVERLTRDLDRPEDIAHGAARLLEEHLGVDRCSYAEVEEDADRLRVMGDGRAGAGSHPHPDRIGCFGEAALHVVRGKGAWVSDDATADPRLRPAEREAYHGAGIRATVCVPLHRAGRLVAALGVQSTVPRRWRSAEVELVSAVASRCWESIERARTAQTLRVNEERFRTLVQSTSQILWTADSSGAIVEDSPSWRAFTGQTPEQFLGRGWLDALHPEDRMATWARLAQSLARGAPLSSEYRLRHADGSWRWTQVHVIPVRDADGKIREWVGMNADITRRKLSERRDGFLVRVDDATRGLSDPDEIAFTSMRMLCEELDADRATYFEVDAEARIGRVVRDYAPRLAGLHGDYVIDDYGKAFGASMRADQPLILEDYREAGLSPEELRRFEEIQISAVIIAPLHKNRRLTAMVGVYQGRPRRWTPEEAELARLVVNRCWEAIERARVARELAEADRRKDEFIATLAHELRNPLAPLSNSLAVLNRNAPGVPLERLHAMMERQVEHLVRMVDDLLDVSRITRGKIDIRREAIDLREAIRNAVDTARPWIDAARHRLDLRVPSSPVPVEGDGVRLTQIFANLLNNASKYTPDGGAIAVDLRVAERWAVAMVTDDGIGIAPDMRARVFDIFAQAPEGRMRTGAGLGIGLALVKSLVALHGGTVSVRSDGVGKGSAFEVRLPLAASAAEAESASSPTIEPVPGVERVLVVDDNRDAADSVAILLSALGANVRVAYDGEQALALLDAHRPTVAFLDIGMPGMDGHELARRIRLRPEGAGIVLVALTGWGQEGDKRRTRETGFDHHFVKPIGFAALQSFLLARRVRAPA